MATARTSTDDAIRMPNSQISDGYRFELLIIQTSCLSDSAKARRPTQIRCFPAVFSQSGPRFCEECAESIKRTPRCRCNLGTVGDRIAETVNGQLRTLVVSRDLGGTSQSKSFARVGRCTSMHRHADGDSSPVRDRSKERHCTTPSRLSSSSWSPSCSSFSIHSELASSPRPLPSFWRCSPCLVTLFY